MNKTMNDCRFIKPDSGNCYLYGSSYKYSFYIPEVFSKTFNGEGGNVDLYYHRKYRFFQEHGLLNQEEINLSSGFSADEVRKNLANLRHLVIEVTDGCNLKCKYCGYGEFYSNHDERRGVNQTFENVKVVIDYLYDLWKSDYNISANNVFTIGFYGGEPLLNMKLIKEVIQYVNNLDTNGIQFIYSMTTNGMLLDRYMEIIANEKFWLLISLDGDEYGSSYRVDHQGQSSFPKVIENIKKLRDTYPDYFSKYVSFNAVLHDRNSVSKTVKFVHDSFDKPVRLAELNTLGIAEDKQEEFWRMFNVRYKSLEVACQDEEIVQIMGDQDSDTVSFRSMMLQHTGNHYKSYIDLFETSSENEYLPTSTCKPFERKLFITVNGKIFPCEKIGQEYPLGKLEGGTVHLDCDEIARFYSKLYRETIDSCKKCQSKRTCGQCLYFMPKENGHLRCANIMGIKYKEKQLADYYSYAESNPNQYNKLLSTIKIR